jgi:hypothetical protein
MRNINQLEIVQPFSQVEKASILQYSSKLLFLRFLRTQVSKDFGCGASVAISKFNYNYFQEINLDEAPQLLSFYVLHQSASFYQHLSG